MSFIGDVRSLVANKARELRHRTGTPDTRVDSGGTVNSDYFTEQAISRSELREIKEVRESGGAIAQLVHAKALMQFGTGVEFQADSDEVAEWLNEQFHSLDNIILQLGEDALWYPYALLEPVETMGGGFSHLEFIEPWTMEPKTDATGEIVAWEQQISADRETEVFDPDEIASIVLNKSNGRDRVGISEVKRAETEIEAYQKNHRAIMKAIEVAAYPHHVWQVGREGAAPLDDNELRRVRSIVDDMEGDTQFVVGQDVEHSKITAADFKFDKITEHDLRKVALALGLPLELANVGSDGLGSGMPADLRLQLFERQARAHQKALANQFIEQIVIRMLRLYSPFNAEEAQPRLVFGDPVSDQDAKRKKIDAIGQDMTVNERRDAFDLAPLDDEDLGEDHQTAAKQQAPDEAADVDETGSGGIAGLFSEDSRQLETFDDYPEAAQENARMALDAREETGNPNDCGTRVGWERANQLDNGESLSRDTIARMAAFERHQDNKEQSDEEGRADCGWMMWKAWGGDEGIAWANDKLEEIENRENSQIDAGAPTRQEALSMTDGGALESRHFDDHFLDLWDRVVDTDETDRALVGFSESVTPEFVKDRIRDAIFSGSVFSEFDTIPSGELMQLREYLLESLQEDGWTIDGVADQLMQLDGVDTRQKALTIARTETAATLNTAREIGYEELGQDDDLFYWEGNLDGRQTDACEWLIKKTNPQHGGNPVSLSELKDLIEEAPEHDDDMDDNLARPDDMIVHPNERKSWVRHVE